MNIHSNRSLSRFCLKVIAEPNEPKASLPSPRCWSAAAYYWHQLASLLQVPSEKSSVATSSQTAALSAIMVRAVCLARHNTIERKRRSQSASLA